MHPITYYIILYYYIISLSPNISSCRRDSSGLKWNQWRVLFENRPALYFFNYSFISAYKIYFFIPYQRYCFRSFVCATEFHCQLWFWKWNYSSRLSIKSSINKVSNIHSYIILFILFIITKIECWPVFKQEPRPASHALSPTLSINITHHSSHCTGLPQGAIKNISHSKLITYAHQ